MTDDFQGWVTSSLALYKEYGLLLSQSELDLVESNKDKIVISTELENLMAQSHIRLEQDLELQFKALEEAEEARDAAVLLRQEAEDRGKELRKLNEELESAKRGVEEKLEEEKTFRLTQLKGRFQQAVTRYLSGLVVLTLLLPFAAMAMGFGSDKLVDSANNITIILLTLLSTVVAGLFNSQDKETKEDDPLSRR